MFVAKYAGGSPEAQILALIAQVDALVADGVLKRSRGRRLTKTLDRALLNVRRDKPVRACIDLAAFVVQVTLQVKLRWLPKDDGQALIQGALAVIDELGCRRR
jgi:hypothetical protein